MSYPPGLFAPSMGMFMPPPMPMYPAIGSADIMRMGMGMMSHPSLYPNPLHMGMGMSGYHPSGLRSRHSSPYYHQTYSYGPSRSGGAGARYLDHYDLFEDVFEEDGYGYGDDYDDIDDPLLMWMRMARGGGRGLGRRGRRGRYGYGHGRYGGGGIGYHGLL